MRLDGSDEDFLASQIEGIRSAIEDRANGDVDRCWTLGRRLAAILVAEAHARLASTLGLSKASDYNTPIEVHIDGIAHSVYEAGELRSEIWVALLGSAHGVIDDETILEETMAKERIGDDALPWFEGGSDGKSEVT